MNRPNNPSEDIKIIRQMMEESSKFLSLSGLSGISAGIAALIGAAIAHWFILDEGQLRYNEFIQLLNGEPSSALRWGLAIDGLVVLLAAVAAAWYFSWRRCQKDHRQFWTGTAKKMTGSLLLVLVIGGVFSLILFLQGYFKLIAPVMLIFYGLSLVNASKYSHRDIKYLGYSEIAIGLIATIFLNYSLLFWTIGFGLFHIVYGTVMYLKYDIQRKEVS